MIHRTARTLILVLLSVAALGCGGSDGPKKYEATGTVTYKGSPLKEGEVRFLPTSGKGTVGAAQIRDGQFTLMSEPGSMRIEIRSGVEIDPKKAGLPAKKGPGGMTMPVLKRELLPPKYHRESTLNAEVTPDGDNEFEFHLE